MHAVEVRQSHEVPSVYNGSEYNDNNESNSSIDAQKKSVKKRKKVTQKDMKENSLHRRAQSQVPSHLLKRNSFCCLG
jgi:hypothetical protein